MTSTATAIGRGALAGVAGAALMSVSTNAEMRLRRRPPSDAPARVLERLPGVATRTERGRLRLGTAGHLVTSVVLGAARGAMEAAGVPRAPARAAFAGLVFAPEFVVAPALRATPPPWRWSRAETAITLLHHGVYATAVELAYARLRHTQSRPIAAR